MGLKSLAYKLQKTGQDPKRTFVGFFDKKEITFAINSFIKLQNVLF